VGECSLLLDLTAFPSIAQLSQHPSIAYLTHRHQVSAATARPHQQFKSLGKFSVADFSALIAGFLAAQQDSPHSSPTATDMDALEEESRNIEYPSGYTHIMPDLANYDD